MRLFSLLSCGILLLPMMGHSVPTPLPVPKTVRIESASRRMEVWNQLNPEQKELVYHLLQVARLGKDLLFFQNHRHGLLIKNLIEKSLSASEIKKTKALLGPKAFKEYLVYSAKFLDQSGPYASSNRKYILKQMTDKQIGELLSRFLKEAPQSTRTEISDLLLKEDYEVLRQPEDPKGAGLESVGGNLYEKGLTGLEVQQALSQGLESTLNCRIIKKDGKLACLKQTTSSDGIVGERLSQIVEHLKKALPLSKTEQQRKQIKSMIQYFEKGNIEDFREANIAWVKDRSQSPVDFMMGWVEVYEDYLAKIGSWETYVQVVDPEVSKIAQSLATHAQYFESNMPYGQFKKTFPKDYSPPAIMVYYFQEISSYRTGGYNLPNFDDIRRDVGAKNVIRLPLPGEAQSPDIQAIWSEVLDVFGPPEKKTVLMKAREKAYRVLVLLHEIIGHGSGTYDESKFKKNEDPISALGSLASALEEQRADLTALVFSGDPILVEVGLYKDKKEAKEIQQAQYDLYLVDFLRRTSGQRTFTEAHQRGHWLFVNKLLEQKAIEWDKMKKYLRVKSYEKFYEVAVNLLGELQSIKANREEAKLTHLFETYAPLDAIKEPWAQSIIERGKDLKINAGYVEQPWAVVSGPEFRSFGGTDLESIAPYFNKMGPELSHVGKN